MFKNVILALVILTYVLWRFCTRRKGILQTQDIVRYISFGKRKTREPNKVETRPWSNLPGDIVRYISDKLCPMDVPHFALVCKYWNLASYPVYPIDRCPLLLNTNDHFSGKIRYYSPYLNKNFVLDTSLEISQAACHFCCSKDGYVLLYKPLNGLILVNPLTGSLNEIPPLEPSEVWPGANENSTSILGGFDFYTFWGKPNRNLKIFGINSERYGYFNSTTWVYDSSTNGNKRFSPSPDSCLVKHSEKIYCLGKQLEMGTLNLGRTLDVGIFDLKNRTWSVLSDLKAPEFEFNQSFLVESKGEILCVLTRFKSALLVLRLNEEKKEWERVENLGSDSLFVGSQTSLQSTTPFTKMENKVYLMYYLTEQPETVQAELRVRDGRVFFIQKHSSFSQMKNLKNCVNESTPCYFSLKEHGEGRVFPEGIISFMNKIWFDVNLDSLT